MNLQRSVTRSVIVLIALVVVTLVFAIAAQAGHVIETFDGNLPEGAVCDEPIVGGDGHVSGEYDFAIFREFTGTSFATWLIVYTHGEDIFVDPDAYDAGRSMWDRLTKCKLPSDPTTTTTTQPRDSTTTTTDPPSTTTTTDPGNTTTTSTSTTTTQPPGTTSTTTTQPPGTTSTTTTQPPDQPTSTSTTSTTSTIGPDPSTTSTAPPPGETTTTEPPPVGGVSAGGGVTAGAGEAAVLWLAGGALALLGAATLLAMKRVPGRD